MTHSAVTVETSNIRLQEQRRYKRQLILLLTFPIESLLILQYLHQ